ncbi:hypothetical protein OKA06_19155 [Novosphingobium sp. MW5]|nr:hypothetical protein [Novosphingobium sp. MW5]
MALSMVLLGLSLPKVATALDLDAGTALLGPKARAMNTVESDIVMACRIASDADIVSARQQGRTVAADMGFSRPDQALIATSISELARNIHVNYAKTGTIELSLVNRGSKRGLRVVAKDSGPGIENLEAAMTDGLSTAESLGLWSARDAAGGR